MKVNELLKESAEAPKFDTAKLVKDAEATGFRRMKQLQEVCAKIDNALRNGEVVSTAFEDIKYEINVLIRHAFEEMVSKPFFHGQGDKVPQEIYWDIGHVYGIQELKFYQKKLSKASAEAKQFRGWDAMVKFNETFQPIVGLMQW